MNVLAFDLGGSGGKVLLGQFDGNKIQIENIHKFENGPNFINGGLYWNIINIYNEMNVGIKKAISITNDTITSLGIDTFSNDFAFVSRDGELLSPVRCYRDNRTKKYEGEIYNTISPSQLYKLNGNQNALFNTFMQLAAIREASLGYILDNSYKMLFVPDLLINFLTGKFVSEYTISSVSQLFSFEQDDWCDEILASYNFRKDMFGKLVKPGTIIGSTKYAYNKHIDSKGFKVVAVCEHDTASAFLASTVTDNCTIISSGTWALVGTETKKTIINDTGFKYNIANEGGYPGRHRILRNVMGSWIIQEIRTYYKQSGNNYTYSELESFAQKAKPFQYLIDVDDNLFFAPGNMPEKIKEYCKKIYGHSPADINEIVRCVYESLAMKYRWTIEKLELITEKKLPIVNIVGGGSKDELMCQFTANACNKTVISGPHEATSLGNILVQLIANGKISDIEEGKKILSKSFPTGKFLPENEGNWDAEYHKFKSLFNLN